MISGFTKQQLEDQGYKNIVDLPGIGYCALYRFIFTVGLMVGLTPDDYKGRYCYRSFQEALDALKNWNGAGDPPGEWIKYKGEGGERSRVIEELEK